MPTFSEINGAEPSTVTFKLASVTQNWNSTVRHQEIVTIGGTESTLAQAAVLDTAPASTAWALAVRDVVPNSTTITVRQSTAADLNAAVIQGSTNWSVQVSTGAVSVSTGSIRVHQSTAADLQATISQGSTIFSVQVSTGAISVSTGSVTVHQGSTLFSVQVSTGAVSVSTGSVRVHQSTYTDFNNLARLADRDQSTQVAAVLGTTPASTSYAVTVRLPAPITDSTNNALRVFQVASSGGASSTEVTIRQSTVGDLRAAVYQSTAADLQATVTIGGNLQSTALPAVGSSALVVRAVLPTRLSTSILVLMQNANGSTVLVSSAANVRHRVYAFGVYSTVTAMSSCAFLSSGAKERWGLILGSGSSGITGANLAVAPPGSLFETDVHEALNFTASSTGLYRVSISYFTEA